MSDRERCIVEDSCGNVFADLELPDAEELLMKVDLAYEVGQVIKERGLTQAKAAKLMRIEQPDVSNILNGRLRGFSAERLMKLLTALDRDIVISIRPADHAQGDRGRISVVTSSG